MTDEVEQVEADDDFFEEDLEDAQTKAANAFEGGDIDDEEDELPIGELDDPDDLPPRPGEHAGAEDDPDVDQDLGVLEPEGDAS